MAAYSTMDLSNQVGTAAGIAGEGQNVYTAALNWYVNRNVRLMFDYLTAMSLGKSVHQFRRCRREVRRSRDAHAGGV